MFFLLVHCFTISLQLNGIAYAFLAWNSLGGETSREMHVNQGRDLGVLADAYGGKWDQISTKNLLSCEISKLTCRCGLRRKIR